MLEERKKYLTHLITESVRLLKEQDIPPAQMGGNGMNSSVPPSPVAPSQDTNVTPQLPLNNNQPQTPNNPTGEAAKPFDLDTMIDRLNVIRGGKSFSDPEVYGKLTTFFNGMSDMDKSVIEKLLLNINKIVIQVEPTSPENDIIPNQGNAQPPMDQGTPASSSGGAAMAGGGTPAGAMEEEMELIGSVLSESIKPNIKFIINNKEFDFGSKDHVRILKGLLSGLRSLRDCYKHGSANRHVYSNACGKLDRLIQKYEPKNPLNSSNI